MQISSSTKGMLQKGAISVSIGVILGAACYYAKKWYDNRNKATTDQA